jgi:hypothetical protein
VWTSKVPSQVLTVSEVEHVADDRVLVDDAIGAEQSRAIRWKAPGDVVALGKRHLLLAILPWSLS